MEMLEQIVFSWTLFGFIIGGVIGFLIGVAMR